MRHLNEIAIYYLNIFWYNKSDYSSSLRVIMKKNYFFRVFYILIISFVLLGCDSKPTSKVITVAMNTWPGYEPVLLAKEKGYIEENVHVSRMDSATDVIATFNSGITDVAFVTLDEVLALHSRIDYGVKIIAVLDTSNGGDVILSKPDINNLKDLKGKKIGLESSAIGAYLLLRAFELNPDIDLDEVHIKPMLYSEHEEAFNNNLVSAVVTFEPVKTALLKTGANILFDSSKIPGEIIDVMMVKDETIKNKPDELRAFLKGWFKAVEFIKTDRDKAMSMMARYEGISAKEFSTAHNGILVPSLNENRKYMSNENNEFLNTITSLQGILLKNKMIEKDKSVDNIFTDAILPK